MMLRLRLAVLPLLLLVLLSAVRGGATTTTTIHVSSSVRDDAQKRHRDGSSASPFATLHEARDAMRAGLGRGGPRIVLIEGDHHLHEPVLLDSRDEATAAAPIIYRGVRSSRSEAPRSSTPGGGSRQQASLSAGIKLPSSAFQRVTVPSGATGAVKINLYEFGLNRSMIPGMMGVQNSGSRWDPTLPAVTSSS